jgi:hypothetical protein
VPEFSDLRLVDVEAGLVIPDRNPVSEGDGVYSWEGITANPSATTTYTVTVGFGDATDDAEVTFTARHQGLIQRLLAAFQNFIYHVIGIIWR